MIVTLIIDALLRQSVPLPCDLKRNFVLWFILLVVEIDDAEGASAQLAAVDKLLIFMEDHSVIVLCLVSGGF